MTNQNEIIAALESLKTLDVKYRYLMVISNNNLNNRNMHTTPIKVKNKTAILTLVIYKNEHIKFIQKLNLHGLSALILDVETKNKINIFDALSHKNSQIRIIPISPSTLVQQSCSDLIDIYMSKIPVERALILGTGNLAKRISLIFLDRKIHVDFVSRKSSTELKKELITYAQQFSENHWSLKNFQDRNKKYEMIVSCYPGIIANEFKKPEDYVLKAVNIDVGGNAYPKETIYQLRKLNNPILHVSIDRKLFYWLEGIQIFDANSENLKSIDMECGHTYVEIGQAMVPGEIGVDSLPNPKRIFGQLQINGTFNDFDCFCKINLH